jgi:hypothetical protein
MRLTPAFALVPQRLIVVLVVFRLPWLVERWMDARDRWRSGR